MNALRVFVDESLQAFVDKILSLFERSRTKKAIMSIPSSTWFIKENECQAYITSIKNTKNTVVDLMYSDDLQKFLILNNFSSLYISNAEGQLILHGVGSIVKPTKDLTLPVLYYEAEV